MTLSFDHDFGRLPDLPFVNRVRMAESEHLFLPGEHQSRVEPYYAGSFLSLAETYHVLQSKISSGDMIGRAESCRNHEAMRYRPGGPRWIGVEAQDDDTDLEGLRVVQDAAQRGGYPVYLDVPYPTSVFSIGAFTISTRACGPRTVGYSL